MIVAFYQPRCGAGPSRQGRVRVWQPRRHAASAACVRQRGARRERAGSAWLLRMLAPAARLPRAPSATRSAGG